MKHSGALPRSLQSLDKRFASINSNIIISHRFFNVKMHFPVKPQGSHNAHHSQFVQLPVVALGVIVVPSERSDESLGGVCPLPGLSLSHQYCKLLI